MSAARGSAAGTGSRAGPAPASASASRGIRSSTAAPVGTSNGSSDRSIGSVRPGVAREVRGPLLQEGVPALDRLVGAVGESGRLAGEQLLADQPVINEVERVLEHPLGGRRLAVD